jgi:putative ABC transport system permease protein
VVAWIKIAFRNLCKNRRRSLFTICAIGLGFAAVNIFGGFTAYVSTSLRDGYIYAQASGHLTLFKKGFLTHGKLDPGRYLLSPDEVQTVQEIVRGFAEVVLVTPQLCISGLLSNGEVSTIFIAMGHVPTDIHAIKSRAQGMLGRLNLFTGKPLEDNTTYGVGLSTGLAALLRLDIGANAIAMAPTLDGQINALDVQVFQLFEFLVDAFNDKVMLVPLTFAQALYDTSAVDRLTILLRDTQSTIPMQTSLMQAFAQRGLEVEVKTWEELSVFYARVKDMFNVIFVFLAVIVLVIAVMIIVNTVGMAVMERIREIGTLRALGVKRHGIVRLFAIESTMLGLLGSLFGLGVTLLSWLLVHILAPTWIPPVIGQRVPLEVHLIPIYMVMSLFCFVILSVYAAILPARRAAYQGIVEALGHV